MNEKRNNEEQPQVASKPIPMWIKIMWIFAISWVIYYIVNGLQSTPATW